MQSVETDANAAVYGLHVNGVFELGFSQSFNEKCVYQSLETLQQS